MTKFRCKISDLQKICKMVSLTGKSEATGKEYRSILDMNINALVTNELSIEAIDTLKHLGLTLHYLIDEVIEEGSLPIGDIELFEDFLERFNSDDVVAVETATNRIVITRENPHKVAKVPMASLEAILSKDVPFFKTLGFSKTNFVETEKLKPNLKIVFDAEAMQNVIADGDVVKQRIYPWVIKDGKFTVTVGTETYGEIETEIKLHSIESNPENPGPQNVETGYSSGIDNLFGNFNGKVTVYLVDEPKAAPLIFECKTERFHFIAALAPYVVKEA